MTANISENNKFLNNISMGVGAWAWGDRTMWNFGSNYGENDIEKAFHASIARGLNFFDTAEAYGSGRSERYLGKFIKMTSSPVIVATKFMPLPWRMGRKSMVHALNHSLERLGMEQVDLYQIHWPFPPMPVEFWAEQLAETVKVKKAIAVGVSNYNKSQMRRAHTLLSKYNIPLASNQVEYHLLNRKIEKDGTLDLCNQLGVRVIAYSPLAKGLLTGKYSPETPPPTLRGNASKSYLKELGELISLLKSIGEKHGGKTPGQVALNWTICKGTLPIPGAKTESQAIQNAGAIGWQLEEDEVKILDSASDKFTK